MSDGTILIAVWINGYTTGGYEWISNFSLGTGDYHWGFDQASEKILSAVKSYCGDVKKENLKFWVTGHSRGGALTNMLAIKLIEKENININNIYAYGFATPQYTTIKEDKYKQAIINYVSPHDFVPYVAPYEWGYHRFGTNIIFDDNLSGTAVSKYNSFSGTSLYFGKVFYREELIKAFIKLGGDPDNYTISKQWPIGTDPMGDILYGSENFSAQDYAQNGLALAMTKEAGEGLANLLTYSNNSLDALKLTTLIGSGEKMIQYITDTHSMLMYLAWIDTLYPATGQSDPLF